MNIPEHPLPLSCIPASASCQISQRSRSITISRLRPISNIAKHTNNHRFSATSSLLSPRERKECIRAQARLHELSKRRVVSARAHIQRFHGACTFSRSGHWCRGGRKTTSSSPASAPTRASPSGTAPILPPPSDATPTLPPVRASVEEGRGGLQIAFSYCRANIPQSQNHFFFVGSENEHSVPPRSPPAPPLWCSPLDRGRPLTRDTPQPAELQVIPPSFILLLRRPYLSRSLKHGLVARGADSSQTRGG